MARFFRLVDRWMGEWVGVNAVLRTAYSNKKSVEDVKTLDTIFVKVPSFIFY